MMLHDGGSTGKPVGTGGTCVWLGYYAGLMPLLKFSPSAFELDLLCQADHQHNALRLDRWLGMLLASLPGHLGVP